MLSVCVCVFCVCVCVVCVCSVCACVVCVVCVGVFGRCVWDTGGSELGLSV